MIAGGVKTEPHCDFCNNTAVRWRFRARRTVHHAREPIRGFRLSYMDISNEPSGTDWAACDECKVLIVAGKREELVERAITSPFSQWAPIVKAMRRPERRKLRQMVRDLHDAFWKNREGAPVAHGVESGGKR